MYENATTLNIYPGRLDETVAILRENIVPILRSQPGLLSLALVPNETESQLTILTIWKTAAHAQAIEGNPRYRQAIDRLDGLALVQANSAPAPLN